MVRHSRWYIQSRQNSRQPIHVSQVGRRYVELQISSIVQVLTRRLDAQLDCRNYGGRSRKLRCLTSISVSNNSWTWPNEDKAEPGVRRV
jgi:hypothetical protein